MVAEVRNKERQDLENTREMRRGCNRKKGGLKGSERDRKRERER